MRNKKTILALCALQKNEMDTLDAQFNVVHLYAQPDPEKTLNDVKDEVQGIVATFVNPVRENLINACPNLEIISLFSIGYDNVDLDVAKSRNITVTNTPDVVTADTADTAMGLLINVSRRYVELDAFTRVGRWQSGARKPLGHSLTYKKVGIIGLGNIGQAIATRCAAFGMDISYFGRTEKSQFGYTYYNDLIAMARDVNYLIAVVPGGADTHHIVNTDVLDALGADGFFVNVARGSVVDQDALVGALKENKIAGAGLDVYASEPNVPDDLKTMDNVVLLPHVGAATHETFGAMGDLVIENLTLHFEGRNVKTPVT
jgi:hydroxypyruvate reductase